MQSLAGPCTPPEEDSEIEAVFGGTSEEEESEEYEEDKEAAKKEEDEEEEWSLNLELSKDNKRRKRRVSSTSTSGGEKLTQRIAPEEETHKEAINHRVMETISEKPVVQLPPPQEKKYQFKKRSAMAEEGIFRSVLEGLDKEDVRMMRQALTELKNSSDEVVADVIWSHYPSNIRSLSVTMCFS